MAVPESLKKQLITLSKGKIALVGVGNVLKADDGAGPLLISRLRQVLQERREVALFDAGVTPENQLGPIIRSGVETVIVVDAVDLGEQPGTVRLVPEKDLAAADLSTHAMNPGFFMHYLKENGVDNILFLGIQPGKVGLGEEISPQVGKTLDSLAGLLAEIFAR
jgi:hydrogenase 3 maturation protease